MKTRINALLSMSAGALAFAATHAYAANSCSAYPTGTAEQIDYTELDAKLGALPAPTKPLHFAYVTKTLINEFWQDVAVGIRDEAGKYNIKVDLLAAKDESSLVEQLNLAQTVLSGKPDALLLSPQSDSNLVPVIEAAQKLNIPTIIIDDARTAGASTYIGTDQVAIGAKAADFLGKLYSNGGKVAQIEGQAGSPNARKRIQGYTDTVKANAKLNLVASQPGDWDRLKALNATTNIMRENGDLAGIYANNDGMALGVYEAVKAAGKEKQVAVVGTDGIRQAKKSVAAGEMKATVAEFPYDEGVLGVQMAIRLLACQPVPPWVVSPQAVITADNVKDFPDPPAFQQ